MRPLLAALLVASVFAVALAGCGGTPDSVEPAEPAPVREHSIDAIAGEDLWSESVALTYLSDDGETGFGVRLCRYPSAGVSWVWIHVHVGGSSWSYVDNYLPSSSELNDLEAEHVVYEIPGKSPRVRFERRGAPGGFDATVEADVLAHATGDAPNGAGSIPVRLTARLTTVHAAQRAAGGRNEVFVDLEATVELGGDTIEESGRGKWHEQYRETPRWTAPFSYLAVSDDERSLLAVTSPGRTYGFLRRGDEVAELTSFRIDSERHDREFEITLADGSELSGTATRFRRFSVPIYTDRRPATHVRVVFEGEEGELIGNLNDYEPRWPEGGEPP